MLLLPFLPLFGIGEVVSPILPTAVAASLGASFPSVVLTFSKTLKIFCHNREGATAIHFLLSQIPGRKQGWFLNTKVE